MWCKLRDGNLWEELSQKAIDLGLHVHINDEGITLLFPSSYDVADFSNGSKSVQYCFSKPGDLERLRKRLCDLAAWRKLLPQVKNELNRSGLIEKAAKLGLEVDPRWQQDGMRHLHVYDGTCYGSSISPDEKSYPITRAGVVAFRNDLRLYAQRHHGRQNSQSFLDRLLDLPFTIKLAKFSNELSKSGVWIVPFSAKRPGLFVVFAGEEMRRYARTSNGLARARKDWA